MVIHPRIKIKAKELGFNSSIEIFEANNYRRSQLTAKKIAKEEVQPEKTKLERTLFPIL